MLGTTSMSWHAPSWATQTLEDVEEADEPPEPSSPQRFRRTQVIRPNEQTSLLTKALMGGSDNDDPQPQHSNLYRRRSMASNVSIASTADLTSDTGFTSPARTNTPSPPVPELLISRLNRLDIQGKIPESRNGVAKSHDDTKVPAPRKRCIQFACGTKPTNNTSTTSTTTKQTSHQDVPARKTCIKFAACPTRQSSIKNTPPQQTGRTHLKQPHSPSTPKRSPATPSTPRQSNFRRASDTSTSRPKFLRANSTDLVKDGSQFHEFASETSREDDWIRHTNTSANYKLTINDTLVKENQIRRLAREAEEEAELEEDEEEAAIDEEEDDEDEDEDEDDDDDEDEDGDDMDDDDDKLEDELSDGYHTDEETGFAESDESDVEDGNMALWTLSKSPALRSNGNVPVSRRPSLQGHQSDSSTTTGTSPRRPKMKRVKPQPDAPDLPDSTDFVCGTLDEDRPLEEAYLSCLAARKNGKLRVIPQDIDPSFPASEPEDEDDEDIYNPVHHDSDDDDFVGQMEDIHHGQERSRRRRKSELGSPRKYRSPAPKRHHSPPPKRLHSPPPRKHHSPRGRSPKLLFDRQSPRRPRSPAPRVMVTPRGSPRQGNHVKFNLAARPGPVITKSLPRPGIFTSRKHDRHYRGEYAGADLPVRGAIDIVKGLEKKRQRRKEKFYQKYCNRARRGQIPERKPQPGRGALRMRELGLLMAGKKDQANYVLSI